MPWVQIWYKGVFVAITLMPYLVEQPTGDKHRFIYINMLFVKSQFYNFFMCQRSSVKHSYIQVKCYLPQYGF